MYKNSCETERNRERHKQKTPFYDNPDTIHTRKLPIGYDILIIVQCFTAAILRKFSEDEFTFHIFLPWQIVKFQWKVS